MRPKLHTPLREGGVTLIEVLVTMVIVAVGLLGLAGLQVRGLAIQKDAHGRAIATQLALDIADRMRANTGAVASYAFNTPYGSTYTPSGTTCATACTALQQAQFDLDTWLTRVSSAALPGGWARIERVGTTSAWDVTLMWVETGFRARAANDATVLAALGNNCPAGTPTQVECVRVRVWP